jgi:predicted GTPase
VNVRQADAIVVNKVNVAPAGAVDKTVGSCKKLNPKAAIFLVASEVKVDMPELVRNKRVLVVEDGPSVTHGELREGAGISAARMLRCRPVDPRKNAVGSIREAYEKFPWMGPVMPALGYSAEQLQELEQSINAVDCDAVLLGTPADLRKRLRIKRPAAKVVFEGRDAGEPRFSAYMDGVFAGLKGQRA